MSLEIHEAREFLLAVTADIAVLAVFGREVRDVVVDGGVLGCAAGGFAEEVKAGREGGRASEGEAAVVLRRVSLLLGWKGGFVPP